VAVSGGIDSTVLAHALYSLRQRCELQLVIAHVNHGLRGRESDCDARAVARFAENLGAPFSSTRVDPPALREQGNSRERPSLQEAARTLRYRALLEAMSETGCEALATAHQADDQAETVLLRLLRGSGPDGLGGIPEKSRGGRVVRPLLSVSRAEIRRYAHEAGLTWREDASNGDPRYSRNRLRNEWIPGLIEDFNPQLLRAIANLAEAQRRDAEWIEQLVSEAAQKWLRCEDGLVRIARGGWDELPEALARRLARRAWASLGGGRDVSRTHLERFVAFLRNARPGTAIELPGELRLSCDSEEFRLQRRRVEASGPC
jgi:tRNA(Ile)-lysidine synthase